MSNKGVSLNKGNLVYSKHDLYHLRDSQGKALQEKPVDFPPFTIPVPPPAATKETSNAVAPPPGFTRIPNDSTEGPSHSSSGNYNRKYPGGYRERDSNRDTRDNRDNRDSRDRGYSKYKNNNDTEKSEDGPNSSNMDAASINLTPQRRTFPSSVNKQNRAPPPGFSPGPAPPPGFHSSHNNSDHREHHNRRDYSDRSYVPPSLRHRDRDDLWDMPSNSAESPGFSGRTINRTELRKEFEKVSEESTPKPKVEPAPSPVKANTSEPGRKGISIDTILSPEHLKADTSGKFNWEDFIKLPLEEAVPLEYEEQNESFDDSVDLGENTSNPLSPEGHSSRFARWFASSEVEGKSGQKEQTKPPQPSVQKGTGESTDNILSKLAATHLSPLENPVMNPYQYDVGHSLPMHGYPNYDTPAPNFNSPMVESESASFITSLLSKATIQEQNVRGGSLYPPGPAPGNYPPMPNYYHPNNSGGSEQQPQQHQQPHQPSMMPPYPMRNGMYPPNMAPPPYGYPHPMNQPPFHPQQPGNNGNPLERWFGNNMYTQAAPNVIPPNAKFLTIDQLESSRN